MAAAYTNNTGLPLSMAVWLVSDYYDYQSSGISVTTLLKPLKQVILARRVSVDDQVADVMSMVQNRMGAALHDSVEKAWVSNADTALKLLGYPNGVRARVKINPDPDTLKPGDIPVYLEQRASKVVGGVTVSGKFDFVGDGSVEDVKSTGVFAYVNQTNNQKYILQGSMYRWLNPKIITKDVMTINFIFTDWQKAMARQQPDKYPQARMVSQRFKLMPVEETQLWVERQIQQLVDLVDAAEEDIPPCTDEELWRSEPVYKYYKNPAKATEPGARSTKNFDNLNDAMVKRNEDGAVGVIKTVPGLAKACLYCAAFTVCKQKDALIASGDLVV